MFGYLKPYKPELKLKEYECYKGFYCGLCKNLKKRYGLFSTFFLTYDAAMLAIFYKAMKDSPLSDFERRGCIFCPLKKCTMVKEENALSFSADTLVLMMYFKLKDSLSDKGFFEKLRALLLLPFVSGYKNKAKKKNLMLYEIIEEGVKRTVVSEKNQAGLDAAADGTAYMMGSIFEIISPEREKGYRFGYMLGRFIYNCDAKDDLKKDVKKGNFNPLKDMEKEKIDSILTSSIEETKKAYSEISIYDMKPITDNIVYLGLTGVAESLNDERKKQK